MFIGAYLKEKRIKQKISLKEVSKELKISFYYLQSIENDDFSKTPGGVFTLGFIRSYANYLNLNSNEIINQYKIQTTMPEIPIEISKPVEAFYSPVKMISFFVIVSISISFYFLFINKFNTQTEFAITPDLPENLESMIEEYEVEVALSKLKKINKENEIGQNNIESMDIAKEEFQENQLSVLASKPNDLEKDKLDNIISLKAIKPTWIQLRSNNNEIIYSKLMDINDIYRYSLNDNFTITTGNAGNIIVSIDGKIIGKLGKQGEVLDSINISLDYFYN